MNQADDNRREFFRQIAKAKGMAIHFDEAVPPRYGSRVHLDLNVVDQVIADILIDLQQQLESATEDQKRQSLQKISEKVRKLQSDGSHAEKVGLAFSKGRYFFPQDITRMAENASARQFRASETFLTSCETVCNYTCNCICGDENHCDQFCENACHEICSID